MDEANSDSRSYLKPILYTCLWFFYLYLFINIIHFEVENNQNIFLSGLYFIEFGVHEASHLVTMFFPQIISALAGSVGEILFTVLIVAVAIKQKSYFAAVFGLLWVALAFNSVGRYISDAQEQLIPLVGPSSVVIHDWNYILSEWGLLAMDDAIGSSVRMIGNVIGVVGLLWGILLVYKQYAGDTKY